jgi:quercetin dioxygenase-like cupin family protein
VGARVITADEAFWRPSNLMGVENTDLAGQLGGGPLAARFWRLKPGQASTRHRHRSETELYVVVEGTGRMRIADEPALTLPPHSAVLVEPDTVRQVFNDTESDALWLVVGAPPESLDVTTMTEADRVFMYPDGPTALPPELAAIE